MRLKVENADVELELGEEAPNTFARNAASFMQE
jgi:hypothetical protein